MRWMSIDPGGHMGWALWHDALLVEVGQEDAGLTWTKCRKGAARLVSIIVARGVESLVVEDFLLRPEEDIKSYGREGLTPVMTTGLVLGALDYIGWPGRVTMYSAADAKATVSLERLRKIVGDVWYAQLNTDHKRDAVRHGIIHCRREHLG